SGLDSRPMRFLSSIALSSILVGCVAPSAELAGPGPITDAEAKTLLACPPVMIWNESAGAYGMDPELLAFSPDETKLIRGRGMYLASYWLFNVADGALLPADDTGASISLDAAWDRQARVTDTGGVVVEKPATHEAL